MLIVYKEGIFKCFTTYEQRLLPKNAGFRWNADRKEWYTPNHGVASKLIEFCDGEAKKEINRKQIQIKPWAETISIPEKESLYPYQEDSVRFALARNRSYLALDPGLGKTPVAACVVETLQSQKKIACIYICPPFLTRNTELEFKKWAPTIPTGRYDEVAFDSDTVIIPDSMITREHVRTGIRHFLQKAKTARKSTILIVDEAHRYKNDEAARTRSLFGSKSEQGIADWFDRVIYLSGTPMPNRPIELFSVLNHSASDCIDNMNKFEFATRYCAAFQNHFGWDFSGASNVKELVSKVIGPFMLRYKKTEVLKDLPPKLEEMVLLDDDLPPKLAKISSQILEDYSPEDLMEGRIAATVNGGLEPLHLSTYRKELGKYKAESAAQYIKYLLEETDEAILVFAIHKDVIAILEKELSKYWPLVITGDTRMELRHEIVKTFQTDARRRLFIGNIQAAGVGLTLTKATRVVFTEFSWVPAENDQASDRAHRIGQDDRVLVQYLVQLSSVDRAVVETILSKKRVTEQL